MLSNVQSVQVSDTTGDDSNNVVRLRSPFTKKSRKDNHQNKYFFMRHQVYKWFFSGFVVLSLVAFCNNVNAQTSGDYRSKQTGKWSAATSWQTYNGTAWVDAAVSPGLGNGVITIQAAHTITSDAAVTADQIVINTGGILSVSASTFNLADGTGTDLSCNGTLTITGVWYNPVVLNGAGSITINSGGVFNWTIGTLGGSGNLTIASGASFNVSGNGDEHFLTDSRNITNSGTWTWSSGGLNVGNYSGAITNSGIFNIYTDYDLYGSNSGAASFTNQATGVINKIGSPNDDTRFSDINSFTNSGTININSSIIRTRVTVINSGAINVAFGASLNIDSDTATFNTGTIISGAGNMNVNGAVTTVNAGTITISNVNVTSGTLTVTPSITMSSGGIMSLDGGILNGAGGLTFNSGSTFNWSNGTLGGSGLLKIKSGANFNMTNYTHTLTDSRGINNAGTWTWTAGGFYCQNSTAQVTNSGTFNISTDNDIYGTANSLATFNNQAEGIINKIGSPDNETNITDINSFTNAGTINVKSSALRVGKNAVNSGTIKIAAASSFNLSQSYYTDTVTFNTGSVISGEGALNFYCYAGTINAANITLTDVSVLAGTLNLIPALTRNAGNTFTLSGGKLNGTGRVTFNTGSTFNWTGGTLGGSDSLIIRSGAAFNISGSTHTLTDSRNINNYSTWTWTGGDLYFSNSIGAVNNYSVININADAGISGYASSIASFTNFSSGEINKSGLPSGSTSCSGIGSFNNSGIITVNPGNFNINVNGFHNGQYRIQSGSQLGGSINMPFTGSTLTNYGTIALSSGLTLNGLTAQVIDGSGGFINSLIVNNANGISITGRQAINNTLNLTNGKLMLGNGDLIMKTGSSLSGGSAVSYIYTTLKGSFQRRVLNNATNVLFPTGTLSSYMPVNIQLNTASTSDDITVRLLPNVYSGYNASNNPIGNIVAGNVVNSTWIVKEAVPGGSNATINFQWNAVDEAAGFARTASRSGQYIAGVWGLNSAIAASGSNPYTLSTAGITSFSPFGIINKFVSCLNSYSSVCRGNSIAVPYIATGIFNSGNIFTAQLSNATGSFSAPVNIGSINSNVSGSITAIIPALTTVGTSYRIRVISSNPSSTGPDNGSNISITSCFDSPVYSLNADNKSVENSSISESHFLVYPNPTNGYFTISLDQIKANTGSALMQIVSLDGKVFVNDKISISNNRIQKQIQLNSTLADGIYMIRLIAGGEVYTKKIFFTKSVTK